MVCSGNFDFHEVTHSCVGTQGSLYEAEEATEEAFSNPMDRGRGLLRSLSLLTLIFSITGVVVLLEVVSIHGFSPKLLKVIPGGAFPFFISAG